MITVTYSEAVEAMEKGLEVYLPEKEARRMAEIFAGNSADGVHSHGMNRYARCLNDMKTGICDAKVLKAEKVASFGALERWDAHYGVGPLIAEQSAQRAMELADQYGIGCVAVANNSHWLRAGRYALSMADAGYAGFCFTNTSLNITAYGAKQCSTGNNPIAIAIPRESGSLLMDMAVSQYAYGKLEIMAQEGKQLPTPCGYDTKGELTCDPSEIKKSGLMLPMAMWKGSALSIMLDLLSVVLSGGRTSREIGEPSLGEAGLSQVYICMKPSLLGDTADIEKRINETVEFLHHLTPAEGDVCTVHAPGEGIKALRAKHMENGIPVTEETWAKIKAAANA